MIRERDWERQLAADAAADKDTEYEAQRDLVAKKQDVPEYETPIESRWDVERRAMEERIR